MHIIARGICFSLYILVEDPVKSVFKQLSHLLRGYDGADFIVLSGTLLVPADVIVCIVIDDRAMRSALEKRTVRLECEKKRNQVPAHPAFSRTIVDLISRPKGMADGERVGKSCSGDHVEAIRADIYGAWTTVEKDFCTEAVHIVIEVVVVCFRIIRASHTNYTADLSGEKIISVQFTDLIRRSEPELFDRGEETDGKNGHGTVRCRGKSFSVDLSGGRIVFIPLSDEPGENTVVIDLVRKSLSVVVIPLITL